MEKEKNILSNLTPKQTFIMGSLGGIMVLCTIGFFILLGLFLSGNDTFAYKSDQLNKRQDEESGRIVAPEGNSNIKLAKFTGDEWYKGGKDAEITIVEFSDTECPFCKRFHETMNRVIAQYGDKVKWVYRHAPLSSLHRKAQKEAEGAECAGELGGNGGFWKFTDRLFEITPSNDGLDLGQLPQIAQEVGLDKSKFEACLNSGKFAAKIQSQLREAESAGMHGTPYSVIIAKGQTIPISGAQPFEQIQAVINSLL